MCFSFERKCTVFLLFNFFYFENFKMKQLTVPRRRIILIVKQVGVRKIFESVSHVIVAGGKIIRFGQDF